MCSSTGTIVARYGYDPYGVTTLVQGSNLATFQYAGYYAHQPSGLNLTLAGDGQSTGRAYDANTGRWLSRDPLRNAEMEQGPNLYLYVDDQPLEYIDPLGTELAHYRLEMEIEDCPCTHKSCFYRRLDKNGKIIPYASGKMATISRRMQEILENLVLQLPGTCGKPCPKTVDSWVTPEVKDFRVEPPTSGAPRG